jgi:hypothetical protein
MYDKGHFLSRAKEMVTVPGIGYRHSQLKVSKHIWVPPGNHAPYHDVVDGRVGETWHCRLCGTGLESRRGHSYV